MRYDARVIREFAQNLYNQADFTLWVYTIGGIIVGFVFGRFISPQASFLGLVIIGVIGFLIGQARAFELKLQAQVALCQVQIEENTRPLSSVQSIPSRTLEPKSQKNASSAFLTTQSAIVDPSVRFISQGNLTGRDLTGASIADVESIEGKPESIYTDERGRTVYEYPNKRLYFRDNKVVMIDTKEPNK